jgi:hypothetical protein
VTPSCGAPDGELVGWWYAGAISPGETGAVVTMPTSVRVRADYPSSANHFVIGAQRCSLPAGARVRLREAPVHVPGDRWWVPLYGGDVE